MTTNFKQDLGIHAACLPIQLIALYTLNGIGWEGSTPPFIYPFWIILATVTFFRAKEQFADFGSVFVYVPLTLITLILGFCLINEIGAIFWAFYTPRWYPAWVRIVWYQSVLLLLHPQMYQLITNKCTQTVTHLKQQGYFRSKLIITLIVAGVLMWLLRNQNLSPDGYDWLKHSVYQKNWTRYLREPMGTFILRTWVYWGMHWFHWAPYVSITMLTICCGLLSSALIYPVIKTLFGDEFAIPVFAFLLCTFGYAQVFTGNIEIYALLQCGLIIFLLTLVQYKHKNYPAWHVGFWFGILFCIHLSAGWWLPAFFLFPLLKHKFSNYKNWIIDSLIATASMFGVCVLFGLFVLWYGYNLDFYALWAHFWSDQVMLVGTDAAMFRPLSDYSDPEYYLTMINEYYFMFSGGCVLLITLISAATQLNRFNKETFGLLILTLFYLVYSITWRPDRHFPADWDLFSGLTIPFILLLSLLLVRSRLPKPAIHYIVYQCTVFSGTYAFLQILRNHLEVSEWPPFL